MASAARGREPLASPTTATTTSPKSHTPPTIMPMTSSTANTGSRVPAVRSWLRRGLGGARPLDDRHRDRHPVHAHDDDAGHDAEHRAEHGHDADHQADDEHPTQARQPGLDDLARPGRVALEVAHHAEGEGAGQHQGREALRIATASASPSTASGCRRRHRQDGLDEQHRQVADQEPDQPERQDVAGRDREALADHAADVELVAGVAPTGPRSVQAERASRASRTFSFAGARPAQGSPGLQGYTDPPG